MWMAWPVDRSVSSPMTGSGQGTVQSGEVHWQLISNTHLSLFSHFVCWNASVQDKFFFYLWKSRISSACNAFLSLTAPTLTHPQVSAQTGMTSGRFPLNPGLLYHPSVWPTIPLLVPISLYYKETVSKSFKGVFFFMGKKLVAKVCITLGNKSQFKGMLF